MLFRSVLLLVALSIALAHPDQVHNLPGLPSPPAFAHYSGYLNTTSDTRFLHYWFVESQRSPVHDPLVLWMNGGPGCSSLDGLLTEQGPFHVNPDGKTLFYNTYSWNKVANVIFLEAPAGVGFSVATDGNVTTNDDQTAADNHAALRHFFRKFPQYKSNDFYITGESYGGVYVPTLAVQVMRNSPDINLKGWAVGNGYLHQQMLGDSLILFGYFHGIYGNDLWRQLVTSCCSPRTDVDIHGPRPNCSFVQNQNPQCRQAVQKAANAIRDPELDIYNLYSDCAPNQDQLTATRTPGRRTMSMKLIAKQLGINHTQLFELSQSEPPCIDDRNVARYLNQPEVRQALHIRPEAGTWDVCSTDVEEGVTPSLCY